MKTIAIIGYGSLGKAMGSFFLRFGDFEIKAYDKTTATQPYTMREVVTQADAVFLCIPASGFKDFDWGALVLRKKNAPVVLMSKGLTEDAKSVTELAEEGMGKDNWCWMGGPMFSDDVANGCWRALLVGPAAYRASKLFPPVYIKGVVAGIKEAHAISKFWVWKNVFALIAGYIEAVAGRSLAAFFVAEETIKLNRRFPASSLNLADIIGSSDSKSRNYKRGMELAEKLIEENMPEGQTTLLACGGKIGRAIVTKGPGAKQEVLDWLKLI